MKEQKDEKDESEENEKGQSKAIKKRKLLWAFEHGALLPGEQETNKSNTQSGEH